MAYQIFNLPKQVLHAGGSLKASWKVEFFVTGTSTPADVYTTSALSVAHSQPIQADSAGVLAVIYLDPEVVYKASVYDQNDVLQYTIDPINDSVLSAAIIGGLLYPRTAAEISAGVTPTNYAYPPGDVRRYGAVGDGVTNDTSAIQAAINVGGTVYFPSGTFLCSGLTQSTNGQRILGYGDVNLKKNANGAHFTSTGSNVELNGIGFRGDASSPTFTGDGIVMSGDHVRLINCGSRWCPGIPLKITGNHAQVYGTCDLYQTTDATSGGYDIQIGVSGTATLYTHIRNVYSSQSTGGIRFIDTGGHIVEGSQFGKLFVDAGTSPAGVNGGHFIGNRILGNVTIEISNAVFSGNLFSAITFTLVSGTSGHAVDDSNGWDSSATITDDSTGSNVVDIRLVYPQTYSVSWTGAGSNPAIGNGSLSGYYTKRGREVFVSVNLAVGSTTTFGTGAWYFSLPFTPSTSVGQLGAARILDSGTNLRTGVSETLQDGTARCQVTIDSDTSVIDSARPMTWANGDELKFTLRYFT